MSATHTVEPARYKKEALAPASKALSYSRCGRWRYPFLLWCEYCFQLTLITLKTLRKHFCNISTDQKASISTLRQGIRIDEFGLYSLVGMSILFVLVLTPLAFPKITPPQVWTRMDRTVQWPDPQLIYQGLPLIAPRGIMINEAQDTLWIGDPGNSNEPSRIVRFPLVDGIPQTPDVFFLDPDILIQAKWAFPTRLKGQDVLLVADQGEQADEAPCDRCPRFTGKGAKVLQIPINQDGSAGTVSIIWQEDPFVCPTGILRIGDYALITDPCAGPQISHPEEPNIVFTGSTLYALRLDGTEAPISLHEGSPFTSMIGICDAVPGTVLINDVDAGRIDPTGTGGHPDFAPPAGAEKFIFDLVDANTTPPTLSNLRRQPIFEEGSLTFGFDGMYPSSAITFCMLEDNFILDRKGLIAPSRTRTFLGKDLTQDGRLEIFVASSTLRSTIEMQITIDDDDPQCFIIPKDKEQTTMWVDNKHAGARRHLALFDRFTVDQGSATIWVYPEEGETPVRIAAGGLISQPLSGQLDPMEEKIWIVDKANASLYEIPFPSHNVFQELFPFRGQFYDSFRCPEICRVPGTPALPGWAGFVLAGVLVVAGGYVASKTSNRRNV